MSSNARVAAHRADTWILGGWITAIALMRSGRVEDTDPYWQIRAGQEFLRGTPLAHPDTWSWAPVDGLFYPNSPAWNAALGLSYSLLSWWGFFLLSIAAITAYFAIAVHLSRRLGAGDLATTVAVIVTSLAALPMLSPRAGVASQALLMGAIAAAYAWSSRAGSHSGPVNALVIGGIGLGFSFVGNWIHLTWSTLAIAVAISWALIWVLTPGLGWGRRSVMVLSGSIGLGAGVLLGPYGTDVYTRAARVIDVCRGLIIEWTGAFSIESGARWALPAVAAIALGMAGSLWCLRAWRLGGRDDPRIRLVVALLVPAIPSALAGVVAIRFTGLSLLTLMPLTALAVSASARYLHRRAVLLAGLGSRRADYTGAPFWRVILAATLLVISPFVLWYASPHGRPSTYDISMALPANCRLFSVSNESAAVILLRPDIRVWFDGRADYWGRSKLLDMEQLLFRVDEASPVPAGTTCILLPTEAKEPSLGVLARVLDSSPDWVRATEMDDAVVWIPAPEVSTS